MTSITIHRNKLHKDCQYIQLVTERQKEENKFETRPVSFSIA